MYFLCLLDSHLVGGGAKGIAHIGVIEALKDNGINIDYISGTSSGSIVAALYSMGYTPNEMLKIVIKYKDQIVDFDRGVPVKLLKLLFTKKLEIKGFVKGKRLENIIKMYSKKKDIENINEINMPLAIPVVELMTGGVTYYLSNNININKDSYSFINHRKTNSIYDDIDDYKNEGKIWDIVRASSSFPGVFVPKDIDGKAYIDGGVRANTPVEILRKMGATKVISISFDCNNKKKKGINNIIGISSQSFNVLSHDASEYEIESSDINIRICLDDTTLLDFSKPVYLATKGQESINKNIIEIKKKLDLN